MYKYNIKMSIENDLHELTDQSEIESYCDNIYKNWIVDVIDDYASDYSILKKSWNQICEAIKMDPKKIITVSHLPIDTNDPDYSNIHRMADVLSSKGYLIRRGHEILRCPVCGKGIISKDLYDMFKPRAGKSLPSEWSSKCQSC